MSWILDYFRNERPQLPITQVELTGKTIIITGANTGIGFEAAKHFALMNPSLLILACRSEDKGIAAAKDITQATGFANAVYWHLDLSSFESVRAFATRFKSEGRTLDILIANATTCPAKFWKTADEWESGLQINYLSTVLLTLLLLPSFSKTPSNGLDPRIIMVGSSGHRRIAHVTETEAPNLLEKLNDPVHGSKLLVIGSRYGLTKLMLVLFARRLAALLPPQSPVTVNIVDPGLCSTIPHVMSEWKGSVTYLIVCLVAWWTARTPEEGSRTYLDAALSPSKGRAAHGRYISECKVVDESSFALSEKGRDLEQRIWDETIDLFGKVDPNVLNVLSEVKRVRDIVDEPFVFEDTKSL